MKEYHKIQTIFKRDKKTRKVILGEYSLVEFEFLKDNLWVFTEKIDGTNIRIMWDGLSITFGGKTDDAQIPVLLLHKLQELFVDKDKKDLFTQIFNKDGKLTEVCLYGEGYGMKIQSNGELYIPDGVDFVMYDVKIGDWWLERVNVENIALKLGIKVVPIIGEGTLNDAIELSRKGFKSQWGNFTAEGIVAMPKTELKTRKGKRVITKIKHKDFNDL
ncbi:MAG: RNA ligase family protein [Candidatus Levybacteria bacterium]|nr:RNA ligase family protein [Candidatus Levybacteria bacterium]